MNKKKYFLCVFFNLNVSIRLLKFGFVKKELIRIKFYIYDNCVEMNKI